MRHGSRRPRVAVLLTISLLFTLVVGIGPPAAASDCSRTYIAGLTPISDLGSGTYQGAQGGLYPGAANDVPTDHLMLGLGLAAEVRPRNAQGAVDEGGGKIGLISVGMSNTSAEFQAFMDLAVEKASLDPHLVLANGAHSGVSLVDWINGDEAWDRLASKVDAAGLTPAQVQAAWIKLPSRQVELPVSFPDDAEVQQDLLAEMLRMLKAQYPNIKIAYMSSRTYGGYGSEVSPEPVAYQHGFAVKWVIEDQIQGSGNLNANPQNGPVVAPWVSWGPYLWANGLGSDGKVGGIPGRSDGLEWLCGDFGSDGIHPTEAGEAKVAAMLLNHFSTDPTACSWFLAGTACAVPGGALLAGDSVAFVTHDAQFHLYGQLVQGSAVSSFYYGNPGDVALMGDWNCDGVATPAMYRPSNGFMYLRNSNTQGVADVSYFYGNPSDIPIAGDFDGDGCDTLAIYRPTEGRVYVKNSLGTGVADYSYYFGNPGDKPFVGDFNGDGVDTVGLHRESSGFVYFRNSNTQGFADFSYFYGNPGDKMLAGDWDGDGDDSLAVYRPSSGIFYIRYTNTQGFADLALTVGFFKTAVTAG
jgi:hypothetical protein